MRKVYLAGPITGTTYKKCVDWRNTVTTELLNRGINAVSPMRGKENMCKFKGIIENDLKTDDINRTPAGITTRDHFDICNADIIFMYMPADQPLSLGTAIELGWADMLDKPVVLVSDSPAVTNHPMVDNIVGWKVKTLEEGIKVVYEMLQPYIKHGK